MKIVNYTKYKYELVHKTLSCGEGRVRSKIRLIHICIWYYITRSTNFSKGFRSGTFILTLLILNSQFLILNCYAQTPLALSVKIYEPNCELGAAKINVTGGTPPYYYVWNTGAGGDSVSSLNGGTYSVLVSDSDTGTADKNITFDVPAFNCAVSISGRFTPNSDGINDTWTISRVEMYPKFLVEVFDRWGQLVHIQRQEFTPWDGTKLGFKLAEATYYYVFFYEEGKSKNIEKGSVTILR